MKDYKKYYIIPASPQDVYKALTQATLLKLWTGEEAVMEPIPDTPFSLWDDSITGVNIAFEEDKKLVQHWDFGEQTEPSEVMILIHPHKQGSSVELRHKNIPDEAFEDICRGWDEVYFAGLADFYEEG
ncbi:MAG: SRPBCC domain-containing protein [Niastella sp.]|nr:SRPBCC domain-containing protein [Niastella sp.]